MPFQPRLQASTMLCKWAGFRQIYRAPQHSHWMSSSTAVYVLYKGVGVLNKGTRGHDDLSRHTHVLPQIFLTSNLRRYYFHKSITNRETCSRDWQHSCYRYTPYGQWVSKLPKITRQQTRFSCTLILIFSRNSPDTLLLLLYTPQIWPGCLSQCASLSASKCLSVNDDHCNSYVNHQIILYWSLLMYIQICQSKHICPSIYPKKHIP